MVSFFLNITLKICLLGSHGDTSLLLLQKMHKIITYSFISLIPCVYKHEK